MHLFIGIDPGTSGGLAWLSSSPGTGPAARSMPATERETWEWIKEHDVGMAVGWTSFCVIEKVQGYIGGAHPGSAMFKFGQSYGGLLMALTAAEIPFEAVTPQVWQKALGIPSRVKDETKEAWKRRLKVIAERLFPSVKVTLATADALLIAEYCRRKREGKL
jgi:hypothetical protein